jgi:hypothetical protein
VGATPISILAVLLCSSLGAEEAQPLSGRLPPTGTAYAYPLIGLSYATPIGAAAGVAVIVGDLGGCVGVGRGAVIQAEVGSDGGKLSLGIAATDLRLVPSTALTLKASVLRTWRRPWRTAPASTYVGPEATFTFKYVKATVGYGWRVGGSGRSRMLVASMGLGL